MARIAFCQDIFVEFMGYMCMSAVLKEHGHTVEMFIDNHKDDDAFLEELQAFKPDIVGFSILSPAVNWALDVAERIKKTNEVITVFGNVHAIVDKSIIKHSAVDIVCRGEGEGPLLELAERVDRRQPYHDIESFVVKTSDGIVENPNAPMMQNLDDLPYHDQAIYDKYAFFRGKTVLNFLAGRGCPYSCSYCTNSYLLKHYGAKQYVRKLSPERAIAELEYHIQRKRPKYIQFIDEVFWVKNDWMREFLTLYNERIRIPYLASFRFGPIKEEDIKLMAGDGGNRFVLASESGSESQRNVEMNKPVKNKDIIRIADWMRKYKIDFVCSAFFGMPNDTVKDHVERLDFYRRLRPTYLWTTFFQPYPGVALSESPDVRSMMPQRDDFDLTLHHSAYLDIPDKDRLERLKKVYYLMVAFPWLEKPLLKLINYNVPLVFNVLFALHFTYYIFKFERISFLQYLTHLYQFIWQPIMKFKKLKFMTPLANESTVGG